ncbi:hypothetical protein [Allorhodopirellula solitaria]|uniref:Uncharacterized protein n=1 Tax=Allorhodopirellula solitaria TaxID=2527987 RepID=A0A5C5YK58_9BACT|nr:hypothetical protein [Allorhodopirellula solitaria]TWT75295.1 hypothetical protein CA85_05850 [Allorhodopirellula solitaria]
MSRPSASPKIIVAKSLKYQLIRSRAEDRLSVTLERIAIVLDSGRRALRMTGAPALSRRGYPMFFVAPVYEEGVSRCTFAIKFGAGAVLQHESRGCSKPYGIGPSLRIEDATAWNVVVALRDG